ncbi:MAG: Crp/Fnr family transcriptional regulator [Desulfovibrio sp.]|nr:Crp/Fnr family transcriptional regulator [Desulfovibrio sp.]
MEKYFEVIRSVSLFQGIAPDKLAAMLQCLSADRLEFQKKTLILMAGDKPENIGVVLAGAVHVVKEDLEGKRTILAALCPGELFAEALCCAEVSESPVSVSADSGAAVMLLRFSRILRTCQNSCVFHQKLIENMLAVVARKNLFLQKRMEILALKSVRAKVTSYLSSLAAKQGRSLTLSMNREEMADYLCVERSALSHELMKMKRDGLIRYRKNQFELLYL